VIRGRQLLADVEVVLGVLAGEVARHGDRRHVVQRGVQPPRKFDHRAGALDVGDPLLRLVGGDVVDRRAVHDMIDVAQLGDGLVGQYQFWQLADQRLRPFVPLGGEAFEASQRLAADHHPHLRFRPGFQQTRHDAAPDKPGTAGNDIPHARHRCGSWPHRQL